MGAPGRPLAAGRDPVQPTCRGEHPAMTTQLTPDRAALSGIVSAATFVGGIAGSLARSDVPYPRPGSDATTIRRFFEGNRGPARISAVGQLVSAATLGRFTASVVRLAGSAGAGPRGPPTPPPPRGAPPGAP